MLRSESFSLVELQELFGGFCPVSGSPVRPNAWNYWSDIKLKSAENTSVMRKGIFCLQLQHIIMISSPTGSVHVCCWPCVCDLQEFVRADTLQVDTRDGKASIDVLVIGKIILGNIIMISYQFIS